MPFLDKEGLEYLLDSLAIKGGSSGGDTPGGSTPSSGVPQYYKFDVDGDGRLILSYEGDNQPRFEIVQSGHLFYYLDEAKTKSIDLGKVVGDGVVDSKPAGILDIKTFVHTDLSTSQDPKIKITYNSFESIDTSTEELDIYLFDGSSGAFLYKETLSNYKSNYQSFIQMIFTSSISLRSLSNSSSYTNEGIVGAIYEHAKGETDTSTFKIKAIDYLGSEEIVEAKLRKYANPREDYKTSCFSLPVSMINTASVSTKMMGSTKTICLDLTVADGNYALDCLNNAQLFHIPNFKSILETFGDELYTNVNSSDRQLPLIIQITYDLSIPYKFYLVPHDSVTRRMLTLEGIYSEFDINCVISNIPDKPETITLPTNEVSLSISSIIYHGWLISPTSI